MHWYAVLSCGTYPPITVNVAQRAALAASYGLWNDWTGWPRFFGSRGLNRQGFGMRID